MSADSSSKPLYRQVADDITAHIMAGDWRPGDRLPSEQAMCERYHVSQITVRRALRELAYLGQVYSHHGLGWFVSMGKSTAPRNDEVAVILPELDGLMAPLVRCLSDELERAGLALRVVFSATQAEAESQALSKAVARGACVALLTVAGPERHLAERYRRLLDGISVPTFFLLREVAGSIVPAVVLDELSCMAEVTRHILALGHRRLAYAGIDPTLIEGQLRYKGFAQTLWEHGLELPMDWVFVGDLTAQAQAERFKRMFSRADSPTALVCASDLRAAEAMLLLHDMDLQCPQDVAIASLGDYDFAPVLATPLTTFRPDLPALGRAAANMARDILSDKPVTTVRVTGRLVVRKSCGAPPTTPA